MSEDLSQRRFDRILLVKPSSLGDVVHALPVLNGLRRRYPDAQVDWLIAPPYAPLIEHHPALSRTVIFDRRLYGRIGRSPQAALAFIAFLKDLRGRRYDLAIDLQGLFRSGFLTFASRAPVRVGFRRAREFAALFYTHYLEEHDTEAHAVDRNYLVAKLLGFEDVPIRFDLGVSDAERACGMALVREEAVCHGSVSRVRSTADTAVAHVVGVVPGTRWETKRWAPQRFAQTIDCLADQRGARCILLGSPEERELCAEVADGCQAAVTNLAGRTGLRQMAAVIASCDAVLCHDSAPMHLAVALGKPVVCLVGPTNPSRTGPYGRADDVCRVELDCSPCYLRRLRQCPHDHRCMRELAVEDVVDRVIRCMMRV